jgi:hypothetical protein
MGGIRVEFEQQKAELAARIRSTLEFQTPLIVPYFPTPEQLELADSVYAKLAGSKDPDTLSDDERGLLHFVVEFRIVHSWEDEVIWSGIKFDLLNNIGISSEGKIVEVTETSPSNRNYGPHEDTYDIAEFDDLLIECGPDFIFNNSAEIEERVASWEEAIRVANHYAATLQLEPDTKQ